MTEPIRILFVDNQVDVRDWLAEKLRRTYHFHVDCADNGEAAMERVAATQGNYDVALVDMRLGAGTNGLEVMKAVKSAYPDIEVIIVTGFGDEEDGVRALRGGACNYVFKPWRDEELVVYIRAAAERRRFKNIERERDWLQNILSVSQATTQSLDPEQVARIICESLATQIPDLKLFYIAHYDDSRDEARFLWAVDADKKVEMPPRPLRGLKRWGLAGYVIKNKKTLFVADLDEDEELRSIRLNRFQGPTRACISIPLISQDNVIGVLSAQSRQPGIFSKDHLRLLQTISNQTAVAIDNAIQHQQTAKRLEILDRLYKTLATLRTELKLVEVLKMIVDNLYDLFRLDTCTVGLFDKYLVKVEFVATRGLKGGKIERKLKDFPPDLRERVFDTSNPVVILDLDQRQDLRALLERPELKSFALLPLHGKKEPLGIVTMGSKTELALSEEQRDLLRALADQAAIAIENARLHEKTEAWAQQLDRLDQIAHDIANEFETTQLLRVVASKASDFLQVAGSGIYLLTEDKQQFRLAAATGQISDLEGIQIPVDKGIIGRVLRDEKPFRVSEYRQWPERLKILDDKKQTAVMGVPIFSGAEILGVLVVHDVTDGREFSKAEEDLLSRIGHLAGIEIEKARILDRNKKLFEEREATSDVTQALVSVLYYDQLLRAILEKLQQRFGYSTCAILLKDLKTNELYIERAIGYTEQIVRSRRIKIDGSEGGVTAWVAQNGEPKIVPDVSKEPLYIRSVDGSNSEIAVPLFYGSKVIGVLNVESTEMNAFSERDNRILTQAAASIAIAIKNAQLYDQLTKKTKALRRLNKVGKAIESTLDLKQVLDKIANYGQELLNAEVCAVFHVRRKGYLRLEANAGSPLDSYDPDLELEIKAGTGVGLTGHITAVGKLVNLYGEQLSNHSAIRSRQPQKYMPSGQTHSLLAIPLKQRTDIKEEVIGLIKVENKKHWNGQVDSRLAFDKQDKLILKTLAGYAETAIQNARLFALANALQEVSQAVNSTLVLDDVLEKVFVQLRKLLPYDSASIQLKVGDSLKIVACDGFEGEDKREVMQLSFPIGPQFPDYEIVTKQKPLLIPDVLRSQYPHFRKQADLYHTEHIRTWLGVPLLHGKEMIGLLAVDSKQPDAYNNEHQELCIAFASQVVSAIVNARWLKSAQGLDLLWEIQDITKWRSLEEVLKRIVDEAVNKDGAIGADIATIHPFDPDKGMICTPPVYAGPIRYPELLAPPLTPESVAYSLLKKKQYHMADEISPGDLFDGPFVLREKIASSAGFPLFVGEEPVGVMFINYLAPHSFTKPELTLINLFAQLAAIAIHNAREHQMVNERLEVATSATGLLGAMASWAHDAAGATFNLRSDVRNLRKDIVELRKPGSSAKDKLQELRKTAKRIRRAAEKVATLIPRMPDDFSRLGNVDVTQALQKVLLRHQAELQRCCVDVDISLRHLPSVCANENALDFVFESLISNAIRHLPDDGTLSFSGMVNQQRVYIEVSNNGESIPQEAWPYLFKRINPMSNSSGTGIGLILARGFLLQCKGEIVLKDSNSQRTTFSFYLPVSQEAGRNMIGGVYA